MKLKAKATKMKRAEDLYIPLFCTTDCRSLFDALQKITPTLDEKRTAIDVAAIKEVVGKKNIRWCPSAFQWGDGFTKLDPALMAKLALFLYDPEITLVAEDEHLEND